MRERERVVGGRRVPDVAGDELDRLLRARDGLLGITELGRSLRLLGAQGAAVVSVSGQLEQPLGPVEVGAGLLGAPFHRQHLRGGQVGAGELERVFGRLQDRDRTLHVGLRRFRVALIPGHLAECPVERDAGRGRAVLGGGLDRLREHRAGAGELAHGR